MCLSVYPDSLTPSLYSLFEGRISSWPVLSGASCICIFVCVYKYLYMYLSVYLSSYLTVYQFKALTPSLYSLFEGRISSWPVLGGASYIYIYICLSIYLSICLSIFLSIYLSINQFRALTPSLYSLFEGRISSWPVLSGASWSDEPSNRIPEDATSAESTRN